MTTTVVGMQGQQPSVEMGKANPEGAKYRKLWNDPQYRKVSPGEDSVPLMLKHMPLKPESHVIDFGCGTGRAALKIHQTVGCRVSMLDFTRNCLDDAVREAMKASGGALTFKQVDLEQRIPLQAAFGICTDVMEHIPTDKVGLVIDNILHAANHVWFQISTEEDSCGELIGETLHLTVKPYSWWMEHFTKRMATIHYAEQFKHGIVIYASAWSQRNNCGTNCKSA